MKTKKSFRRTKMKNFSLTKIRNRPAALHYQGGFSLMESVVSLSVSLVVTAAMVALMSNSLGSTSRIVNMTKLSDDLRSTMQMLTRDVRRASYNSDAFRCYGNEDCFSDGTLVMADDIVISDDANCFTFQLDRGHNGDSTDDAAGGFRLGADGDVGTLEMWTGDEDGAPDCGDDAGGSWVVVTNPATMNITDFNVDDALSYEEVISDDGLGNTITQRVRKVRFAVDAQLVAAPNVTRRMEDVISVRNDFLDQTVAEL